MPPAGAGAVPVTGAALDAAAALAPAGDELGAAAATEGAGVGLAPAARLSAGPARSFARCSSRIRALVSALFAGWLGGGSGDLGAPSSAASAPPVPPMAMPSRVGQRRPLMQRGPGARAALADPAFVP